MLVLLRREDEAAIMGCASLVLLEYFSGKKERKTR